MNIVRTVARKSSNLLNFTDWKLSAVYVNQTNLNVKLGKKLGGGISKGPAKNLGGHGLPRPPLEPPVPLNWSWWRKSGLPFPMRETVEFKSCAAVCLIVTPKPELNQTEKCVFQISLHVKLFCKFKTSIHVKMFSYHFLREMQPVNGSVPYACLRNFWIIVKRRTCLETFYWSHGQVKLSLWIGDTRNYS